MQGRADARATVDAATHLAAFFYLITPNVVTG